MDELEVALFPQRGGGVHPAWVGASRGAEGVREYAGPLLGQPQSLHASRHSGQEADHQAVDDQQTAGVYMHSSRPPKEKHSLRAFPSLLLSLRAPDDCRQAGLQLRGTAPSHQRQLSEGPPRKPQRESDPRLQGEGARESHSGEAAEDELAHQHQRSNLRPTKREHRPRAEHQCVAECVDENGEKP